MEMLIFYIVLVHELSPLIKHVIHQTVLSLTAKTPKPDTWQENPHMMMTSSHTCVHRVTPWGGEGGQGDPPRACLMSGCLILWDKWTPISLFIYTKFQGNLPVLDRQVTFDLSTWASYTPKKAMNI